MPVTDFALHLSKLMRFGPPELIRPCSYPHCFRCHFHHSARLSIWWAEPIVLENSLVVEWHMQDSAAKRNFLSTYVVMWYCGFINEKKIGLRFLVTSWIPFCGHPGRHLGDNPKNQQTRYDVGLFTSHYQSNFGVDFDPHQSAPSKKLSPPKSVTSINLIGSLQYSSSAPSSGRSWSPLE